MQHYFLNKVNLEGSFSHSFYSKSNYDDYCYSTFCMQELCSAVYGDKIFKCPT